MSGHPPFLLRPFPEWEHRVRAAFTTRYRDGVGPERRPASAYADLNLGFRCGDDAGNVFRNWSRVLAAMGCPEKTLVLPRMAHGDVMVEADGIPDPAEPAAEIGADPQGTPGTALRKLEPADADAVYSSLPRRVLAVTMADCLTALVFDPECGTVAAVHAGWRGTRARILEKSLRSLAGMGRIRAASALVAFGPCLRPDSLEVGPEVAAQLRQEFVIRKAGKCYFDMPAENRAQALAAGVLSGNLRDLGGCTLTEPERFFSYRRDGQASGRLAACISLVGS